MGDSKFKRKIYDNVSLSERARQNLQQDQRFHAADLSKPETKLVFLGWMLFERRLNEVKKFEIVRGPHFVKGYILLSDVGRAKYAKIFRVGEGTVCITISRDIGFSKDKKYILEYNKEFYFYPAELDDMAIDLKSLP